jgi:probable phosphoglycerate mutase
MPFTEILLLRHGQSEGNDQGRFGGHGATPLTPRGRAQAAACARVLAAEGGLTAIFASDLPRAVETAMPIAEATGIAVKLTSGLRERSVGRFTDLTFAEAALQFPEEYAALMRREPGARPPDGETHRECLDRVANVLDEAVRRFPRGRTLLVSHAAALHLLLLHVLGLADDPHGARIFMRTDNCALHRLRLGVDGGWTVMALNDRAHLAGV